MLWDVQDFLMLRRWGLRSGEPAPGLAHSQQGPESTLGFPSEWVGRCSADGRGGKPPSCVYSVMSMSVLILVLRSRLPPGTGDGKPAAVREGQMEGVERRMAGPLPGAPAWLWGSTGDPRELQLLILP